MLDPRIKNVINRWTHHLVGLGHSKPFISRLIAGIVEKRGPLANGCTCNNWGPRWIEDSKDLCCPACFAGALAADQTMFVNGVKPVTTAMVEQSQSWGFDRVKIRQLNTISGNWIRYQHNYG
ncbi:MAG: hypothetical protein JRE23_12225 [Deltaproteobacteria bacterium]|nr:hypothetical protein [Deltaproteobacteria bacterium]